MFFYFKTPANTSFNNTTLCVVSDENTITCPNMGISGHLKVELSEVWDKEDVYSFPYLNSNYRGEGDIYLEIVNNGDALISAEEQITFVPSIWGEMHADVIQFITLGELARTKNIKENYINDYKK